MESNAIRNDVFAVEAHSGRGWGVVILIAVMVPMLAVVLAPGDVRWPLLLVAVIGVGAFAMAWGGFQYLFLQRGVDVRMLGFRLRSIPKEAILSYSVESWPFIRGRGIRGIGSTRAYVWGNRVVHIRTSTGDIYLGHDDPGRLVRDLDRVTGFVTRG
jgi:hypothetical protein